MEKEGGEWRERGPHEESLDPQHSRRVKERRRKREGKRAGRGQRMRKRAEREGGGGREMEGEREKKGGGGRVTKGTHTTV